MPTAASSTDSARGASATGSDEAFVAAARRSVADLGHLLRFRASSARRRLAVGASAVFLTLTSAVAVVPAFVPGAGGEGRARDILIVLPTALTAFVLLAVVSAAASGGGRELIAREAAAVFPVSPTTDHLGALLLAPLNIAWMLQAWLLLGMTSYAVGAGGTLVPALLVVLAWLAAGTAFGQVIAWTLEGVRRVPHGISVVRGLTVVLFGVALGLQISNNLSAFFDELPTRAVVIGMLDGFTTRWAVTVGLTLLGLVVFVALGAVPAHIAAHRTPRDELKVETGRYAARTSARSVLGAMVRMDRASVWRAVPMRRGLVVLALGPAFVALLGDLRWDTMTVLPGLVVSGGALLYGVNAWCLDGRGSLWRESLPVPPSVVFDARTYVLAEFLLSASVLTVLVAGLRAGPPGAAELSALVSTLLVVTVQVVGASMRWSSQRPYAVDLRSSRATPAPPAVMVGYSARLALTTTLTGVLFSVLGHAPTPVLAPVVALAMIAWSTLRLLRVRRAWVQPVERARVVTAVAVG